MFDSCNYETFCEVMSEGCENTTQTRAWTKESRTSTPVDFAEPCMIEISPNLELPELLNAQLPMVLPPTSAAASQEGFRDLGCSIVLGGSSLLGPPKKRLRASTGMVLDVQS